MNLIRLFNVAACATAGAWLSVSISGAQDWQPIAAVSRPPLLMSAESTPPQRPSQPPCRAEQLTEWLDGHGIYGDKQFDASIYADEVLWTVNGKSTKLSRLEVKKDEDDFRKVYPTQKYTPTTSSTVVAGNRCVLTQQIKSYKKRVNGREETGAFTFVFSIMADANGLPLIVERETSVLSKR